MTARFTGASSAASATAFKCRRNSADTASGLRVPPSAPPSSSRALLVGALALSSVLTGPAAAQSLAAEEVVARALGASPTIRAARADLDSAAAGVRAADGARVPTLTLNGEGRHTESLNVAANGVASSQQNQLSAGAAATIQTDLGTSITVGLSTSVRWFSTNLDPTRTDLFTIGPIYTGALTLDARQPLLRGAGTDATLGPRREADARRLAADRSLAETTSALARDALLAHWRRGEIAPPIDGVFPFAQVADAHRRIEERLNVGKVVLVP